MRLRRSKRLTPAIVTWRGAPAVIALAAEGAVVAANHGDCPLGPVAERHGVDKQVWSTFLPHSGTKLNRT